MLYNTTWMNEKKYCNKNTTKMNKDSAELLKDDIREIKEILAKEN
ncbi:MAG: hypothetical protein AB7V77_01180 [Candidatus Woesearchaeota archaeon]